MKPWLVSCHTSSIGQKYDLLVKFNLFTKRFTNLSATLTNLLFKNFCCRINMVHIVITYNLKACVGCFSFFHIHQMIALKKLRKMVFILLKKLFPFPRYSIFCISSLFSSVCHCSRWLLKKNLEVYHIINWLNTISVISWEGEYVNW